MRNTITADGNGADRRLRACPNAYASVDVGTPVGCHCPVGEKPAIGFDPFLTPNSLTVKESSNSRTPGGRLADLESHIRHRCRVVTPASKTTPGTGLLPPTLSCAEAGRSQLCLRCSYARFTLRTLLAGVRTSCFLRSAAMSSRQLSSPGSASSIASRRAE
jgi:hypothetical protein